MTNCLRISSLLPGLIFLVGVSHGFLTPFTSNHHQAVCHQPNVVALTVHAADKIPAFSVVEDDDADDNGNGNDWYAEKSEEEYPDEEEKMIYVPPEFTIEGDDDDDDDTSSSSPTASHKPPDITIVDVSEDGDNKKATESNSDDYQEEESSSGRRPRRIRQKKKAPTMVGTSWMEKNAQFTNDEVVETANPREDEWKSPRQRDGDDRFKRSVSDTKTFRQDFRKTRVFVKNIPQGVSWQDLKDHFRKAGNVVFASISVDNDTGESKGHGIVQFETTSMAENAIANMRDHPMEGNELFVREDFQENQDPNARLRNSSGPRGPTPPTKWKCANEDNARYMTEDDLSSIRNLIKARDDARRRRKYEVSDTIRDELKQVHGVFIDDRLKMWWTSVDGSKVPQSIHDIKGEGRWKLQPWRQIPTTPENDACVDSDLVEGLLKQRDISRREKDFRTADALLEEARTSPDGDLNLRIHDESRTWRVWTEERPRFEGSFPQREQRSIPSDPEEARKFVAKECLQIVNDHAPDKLDETITLLKQFRGREFQILKRLKQQYL
ncbi:MAG: hypothetical protein SGILL_006929 [Bacillariaceae sp.]